MNKAGKLFDIMGLKKIEDSEERLHYHYKDDFYEKSVIFEKKLLRYYASYSRFIPNDGGWFAMVRNEEYVAGTDVHTCKYGYWAKDDSFVDVQLHNAIHQQLKELGGEVC